MRVRGIAIGLAALSVSACQTMVGPGTVPEARLSYNEAVVQSANEQLLLNLVRLRYRDPISFLDVTSVTTQYTISAGAGADANFDDGPGFAGGSLGVSGSYQERPTITYAPVRGPQYARELLTPISAEMLFLLTEAGWSADRLMLCCFDRVGDITNARTALGPTPERIPDNTAFLELAATTRQLQKVDAITVEVMANGDGPAAYLKIDVDAAARENKLADLAAILDALDLEDGNQKLQIVETAENGGEGTLAVRGRSMLGVLYALSHTVEAPAEHVAAGWVTSSAQSRDGLTQWRDTMSGLFGVQSADERPDNAFVAVFYRDHWFYIPDEDLDAKATFSLLGHLIALQSEAADGGARPVLTLGG